ncbi:hypothetical protein Ahy_A04g019830 [Arachis hypogaea]|uniref:Laccase n=1 Tax=Arachis hypogaea TaxID=3818 RepID=A0A445DGK9_ARAHY|nr:hypothetical protein Ahy_A04g019830 [Arachis hypogaea]
MAENNKARLQAQGLKDLIRKQPITIVEDAFEEQTGAPKKKKKVPPNSLFQECECIGNNSKAVEKNPQSENEAMFQAEKNSKTGNKKTVEDDTMDQDDANSNKEGEDTSGLSIESNKKGMSIDMYFKVHGINFEDEEDEEDEEDAANIEGGGGQASNEVPLLLLFMSFINLCMFELALAGTTRHYHFDITYKNVTRLCHTKSIVTVNAQFPGPRIVAREGDHILIKLQTGWADGPAYVTQCPIQTGQSYVYNYTITGQRGTLFWHAHISWLRSTLYGPLIILPKKGARYPFAKPHKEVPIIFGEWWNADPEAVISQALQSGGGPNVSDAYTMNGLPGPLYNCSAKDTFKLKVKARKIYLLRLINAALNDQLFFSIANHTLTVVEVDAVYVKPFSTNTILIAPGQTTNVLLKTKSHYPNATFLMMARPYATGLGTFDNSTVAGVLEYKTPPNTHRSNSTVSLKNLPLLKPVLPALSDTSFATKFTNKLRSLASAEFPANVPKKVDRHFFFTVGLGTNPCEKNQTCQGPNGTKFSASVNNVSFALPDTALLQSYFFRQSNGVYTADFPTSPLNPFNYTGAPPNNTIVNSGTKMVVIPYNTSVEVVMQDTSILGAENHPLHLHGFNFFVVGQGFGNFDPKIDPANFNLLDPVERNTVGVPSGGWVAIRFLADNPGVWFMHCHLEVHTSWGLRMAWVVLDGKLTNQKLLPPPFDLPKC